MSTPRTTPAPPENCVQWARCALTGRPEFRPSARMAMEAHLEARRFLLPAEERTRFNPAICRHIARVRADLYAWAWHEHPDAESTLQGQVEIPAPMEPEPLTLAERDALTAGIANVKRLVGQHYPNCPPLRSMLRELDAAAALLQVGMPQPGHGNRVHPPRSRRSR